MDIQAVTQAAFYLAFNLTKALTAFIQRDSFLYWPFLLSAALLALVVMLLRSDDASGESLGQRVRAHFRRDRWWHRSARADYRLYLANALILPALFGLVLFSDRHVVQWLDKLVGGSGATASADASVVSRILFTLIFFVAYDLGRFIAHTLLHDVPLLWEFHKVHHSAETLNPMTTFRAHPIDLAIMAWAPALTTGLATWLFNRVTATPVSAYTFLNLHVLIFGFNLIGILRHSHVWLQYGPTWGKWFISPAHHQLHHSSEAEQLGVNRGFELAVWDRLYGTLHVPPRQKTEFRMGLGDGTDAEWHNVRRMYVLPFVLAARRLGLGRTRRESAGSGTGVRSTTDNPSNPYRPPQAPAE